MPDGFHHLRSLDNTVDVKLKSDPQMSRSLRPNARTLTFDGREDPLGYWGEGIADESAHSFVNDVVADGDMWAEMEQLLALKEPVEWEDTFGNIFHVLISEATWEPIVSNKRLQRIRVQMTRIETTAGGSSGS